MMQSEPPGEVTLCGLTFDAVEHLTHLMEQRCSKNAERCEHCGEPITVMNGKTHFYDFRPTKTEWLFGCRTCYTKLRREWDMLSREERARRIALKKTTNVIA